MERKINFYYRVIFFIYLLIFIFLSIITVNSEFRNQINADILNTTILKLSFYLIGIFILFNITLIGFSKKIMLPIERLIFYFKSYIIFGKKEDIKIEEEELVSLKFYFDELINMFEKNLIDSEDRKNTVDYVLSSLQEGILILDENLIIKASNDASKKFLSLKTIKNINIIHVVRDLKLQKSIKKVKNTGENQVVYIDKNSSVLRFYINRTKNQGYIIIISDVTELIRLENIRSEFTSNVTHELKTPLTSIRGFAELVNMEIVTDKNDIINYSGKIVNESKRLINLVDDILKLSSLENKEVYEQEKFDLRDIFNYVFGILDNQVKEKNITYDILGNFKIISSKKLFIELIFNLVDNAIKYNIENGKIFIEIFYNDDRYGFSIKDTGIGIPQNSLPRIFERFYRVNKGRDRKTGGTGLGLSIVKHIVEQEDGDIRVKNLDKGTEIIILFKLKTKL